MKQGAEWRCASAWGETHLSLAITVSAFRERRPECDTIALTGATDDLLPVAFVAEGSSRRHGTRFCMGTSLPADFLLAAPLNLPPLFAIGASDLRGDEAGWSPPKSTSGYGARVHG